MASSTSGYTFPDQGIDPRLKDAKWILQFIKAMWGEARHRLPATSLYFGQNRYSEIRAYAMGRQPINQYKKLLVGEAQDDQSWATINWNPLALLPKYREIACSKIYQKIYDLQAYAVDPLSKSEEDTRFNEMKIKILMREAAQQQGSELADSPMLRGNPDEPEDMEQLKMQTEFGYKSKLAMEMEMGVQLIQQQNDIAEKRKRVVENLVDYGIGGYTEWIDENGQCRFREINPKNLLTSYCAKNDFSDLSYWGEVIEVPLTDLVPYFTKEQIEQIGKNFTGKFNNPLNVNTNLNKWYDQFKVLVFDAKFLSWNETVYKTEVDSRDNERFGKSSYANKQFLNPLQEAILEDEYNASESDEQVQGSASPKYISNTTKVIYKGKWIIDSEFLYDFGLSENMNRKPSSWWDTSLDIQLYAWSFDEMNFTGMTERLMPLEDKACMLWYKMQNLANKLVPYIISMNLSAMEGVSYGKGGDKNKPSDIADFLFNNFTVLYRTEDLLTGGTQPLKPVEIEATGQLAVFGQYREELLSTIQMMQQVSGLNDATDGSTVGQKTLNGATQAMVESSNNALYLIQNADKQLLLRMADNIISKIQIAVKIGKVEGYVRALGSETVRFLSINPDCAAREFGIYLEDAPTDMQREALWQDVSIKESQGLLTVADKLLIMKCRNLTQAMCLLDYKIKNRKEEQQQFELSKIQEANQGQTQMALQIEGAKQQTIQIQGQIDLVKIQTEMQWMFEIEKLKKQMDFEGEVYQSDARTIGNHIQADAKKKAAEISAEATKEVAKLKPKPTKATA
jgi:hypothetical protein